MEKEQIDMYIMLTTMLIGEIAGIVYTIHNWNNKEVESVDLFYAVFAWWILSPFIFTAAIVFVPWWGLIELANKIRPTK